MKKHINKIIFTLASLAMLSIVIGFLGDTLFESSKIWVGITGIGLLFFVVMFIIILWDVMFN